MPRIAGQIDVAKNEAILDAALEILSERGDTASMEEIARRAAVSKQTIYNHYGSKAELVRALAHRRAHEMAATLDAPDGAGRPAVALAEFARVLLHGLLRPRGTALFRMAVFAAASQPKVSAALYEAGPVASRNALAEFLRLETAAGRLNVPDPAQAAEFFMGMVSGSRLSAALLGQDSKLDRAMIDTIATEAAARFMRAYAD